LRREYIIDDKKFVEDESGVRLDEPLPESNFTLKKSEGSTQKSEGCCEAFEVRHEEIQNMD
jgi:hypothetical protein